MLALASACDSDDPPPVEPDAYLCFAGGIPEGGEEAGVIEIGTGENAYEPVEPEGDLPLVAGSQCGYHFDIRPRIQGLDPGDPDDSRAAGNPRTLVSAYDEDGERIDINQCGYTFGYGEDDGEYIELGSVRFLRISRQVAPTLDGERVRIVAEVLDADGYYARDEVWVVAILTDIPPHCPGPDDDEE